MSDGRTNEQKLNSLAEVLLLYATQWDHGLITTDQFMQLAKVVVAKAEPLQLELTTN